MVMGVLYPCQKLLVVMLESSYMLVLSLLRVNARIVELG
jgi:hypothetical protein